MNDLEKVFQKYEFFISSQLLFQKSFRCDEKMSSSCVVARRKTPRKWWLMKIFSPFPSSPLLSVVWWDEKKKSCERDESVDEYKMFRLLVRYLLSFSWETHEHYRNMFAPQHGPITSFDKTVIICQHSWQRKDEEKYKSWNFMNGQLSLPFISQADAFLCLKVFIRVNSSKRCFEFLWKKVKKGERPSWNGSKLKQFAVNYFSTIRVDNFIKLNFPKNYHIKENSLFKHILQKKFLSFHWQSYKKCWSALQQLTLFIYLY